MKLLLSLTILTLMSGHAHSQGSKGLVRGEFLCLDTDIIQGSSEAKTLEDYQKPLRRMRRLVIDGPDVEFDTHYYFVDGSGWNVHINHNGVVVMDRGLQLKIKQGCNSQSNDSACNPSMTILSEVASPSTIGTYFTWETLVFDEVRLTLSLRQFDSERRQEIIQSFSCMTTPKS